MIIRNILTIVFLSGGGILLLLSIIGVLRLPDFYSRLHGAGIGSTSAIGLCGIGLFIYEGLTLTGIKILLVVLAVLITGPIGTHIIAKVAYRESLIAQSDGKNVESSDQESKGDSICQ